MRKRERENPCRVCGHYHKYEEGEVCGECGHRLATATAENPIQKHSAFPSEILQDFLYLGSYDNASRIELLKTMGIQKILNTVPACHNLYKNTFTYHCLEDDKALQFDNAINFLEQCEKEKVRVLVHCMTGKNRSPAIVIGYLMKCKGWRLPQSFNWVKERRPQVELSPAVNQQLIEYEKIIFRSSEGVAGQPSPHSEPVPPFGFGFGFPRTSDAAPSIPVFDQARGSIFERVGPANITFGGGNEAPMDSS